MPSRLLAAVSGQDRLEHHVVVHEAADQGRLRALAERLEDLREARLRVGRAHRRRRDAEILNALRTAGGSSTVSDVVDVVYEGLSDYLKQGASETVLAHLYKLEAEGRVCKRSDQNIDVWEHK